MLQEEQQSMLLNNLIDLNAECQQLIRKDRAAMKEKRKEEMEKALEIKQSIGQQEHDGENTNEVQKEMLENDVNENIEVDEKQQRRLKKSQPQNYFFM